MKENPKVTILTAMATEDVAIILQKIEDELCDIICDRLEEQTRITRLEELLNWIQDIKFDVEKGV